MFFSHSGNTEEVNYAAELVQKHQVPLLSIVGSKDSSLAHMSDAIIDYVVGKDLLEPLGGAPTSSIIMQVFSSSLLMEIFSVLKSTLSVFKHNSFPTREFLGTAAPVF